MKIQSLIRRFAIAFTIAAFALVLATLPNVSEAKGYASSTASSTKGMNKVVDAACMVEAIDTREDALMDAWVDMSSSTVVALGARRDGLMDAWGMTTMKERTAAIVKTWKEWRTDKKTIAIEFRKDRKTAWEAFKKTAKNECKMTTPKDESLEKATSDSIAL